MSVNEPIHSPWGLGSASVLFNSSGVSASFYNSDFCDSPPPIGTPTRNRNLASVLSVEETQSVSALKATEDEIVFRPRMKYVTKRRGNLSPVVDSSFGPRNDTRTECGCVGNLCDILSERLSHISNEKSPFNEGTPHCLLARALSSSPRNSYFSSYPHEATSLSAPSSTVSSRSTSQVKFSMSAPSSRSVSSVKLPPVPLPLELSECVFSQEEIEENKDEVKRALDYLHTLSDECNTGTPTANFKSLANVFSTSGMESVFGSSSLNEISTSDQFSWIPDSTGPIASSSTEGGLLNSLLGFYDKIFEPPVLATETAIKSEPVDLLPVSDILGSIENSVRPKPQYPLSCSNSSEESETTPEIPNIPVIFVPVSVPPAQNTAGRPACKYWKRGNCRYGENCNFSHAKHAKTPEKTTVTNSTLSSPTIRNKTLSTGSSPPIACVSNTCLPNSKLINILSKEESLAALRFMAHIEEIEANFPDTILKVNRSKSEPPEDDELIITIGEFYRLLESRYDENPVPILVTLNQILNPPEPLSLIDCISEIVPELPSGTLDLDTILNTKRTAHNDALLFFCSILSDIEQHFSVSEFSAKYLRRNNRNTCENTPAVEKVLQQVGIKEEDMLSKLELSESDKGRLEYFRWKSLFISNDPSLISFSTKTSNNRKCIDNASETDMDMKWMLLRSLDNYVRSTLQPVSFATPTLASSKSLLPPFEIVHLRYIPARGHNHRRKLWNEFAMTRDSISIHTELCAHVAKLNVNNEHKDNSGCDDDGDSTRELLSNFPCVLSRIQEKCKVNNNEIPRHTKRPGNNANNLYTIDTKLAKISKVLDACPRLLLLPEMLLREDGKLYRYKSLTTQHQFGSIFTEMMTMLKKKYLHNQTNKNS